MRKILIKTFELIGTLAIAAFFGYILYFGFRILIYAWTR